MLNLELTSKAIPAAAAQRAAVRHRPGRGTGVGPAAASLLATWIPARSAASLDVREALAHV